MKYIFLILSLLVFNSSNAATPSGFQTKGYILSGEGKKCWYKQIEKKSSYFSDGGLKGNIGILTFDKPNCMSNDSNGLEQMVNIMMINQMISNWYSHSDAKFQTRENELYSSSHFQKKGRCMQSKTYSNIGVSVDYITNSKGSIKQVYHGAAALGCKNK